MASESFKYADQSVDAPYTLLHTDNTQLSPQSIWPISRPPWSKDILVNSIINEILFIAFQPKFFTRSLRLTKFKFGFKKQTLTLDAEMLLQFVFAKNRLAKSK